MIPTPSSATPISDEPGPFRSRWAAALGGNLTVLPAIAADSWSPVYVWLRASGVDADAAEEKTRAFFAWIETVMPPKAEDAEHVRISDFLISRLLAYEMEGFPSAQAAMPFAIDRAMAERRFAQLTGRGPNDAFARRWAVAVLENTFSTLRREYEAEGAGPLFTHLQPFLSFSGGSEERYASSAPEAGLSVSAMHVAVFRFRQRYREMLRRKIADTVSTEEEADSELTRLLVAAS